MKSMKSLSFVSLTLIFFPVIYQIPGVAMATGTNTNSIPVTNVATPSLPTPLTNEASTSPLTLIAYELPEIHGSISLPKEWTLLPGKLLEGDVLIATKEKISNENDPYTTGLSMTLDRNGAKESGQKSTEYAMSLAREAHDKAGDEASPLHESQDGPFHEIRFDFPVAGDQPLQITELLRANEKTGTLAIILWQSPKEEAVALQGLRDAILSGLHLDPEK
jgi:hypothetical protein